MLMEDEQVQKSLVTDTARPLVLEVRPQRGSEDLIAFRVLNEEWVTRFFVLEAADREVLEHPERAILGKGGHIFMVEANGEAIGCAALIPGENLSYELSKMAVSPRLRGLGIGRRLIEHVIAQAKAMGAKSLFLNSSHKLENAVHLYESVGFRHVSKDHIAPTHYERADVFMEMQL